MSEPEFYRPPVYQRAPEGETDTLGPAPSSGGGSGAVGPRGPAGPPGPKGDTGAAGVNGVAGANGKDGKPGTTWVALDGPPDDAATYAPNTWVFDRAGEAIYPPAETES